MDGPAFDELVRKLKSDASRRTVIRGAAGSALASILSVTAVEAKQNGKGKQGGSGRGDSQPDNGGQAADDTQADPAPPAADSTAGKGKGKGKGKGGSGTADETPPPQTGPADPGTDNALSTSGKKGKGKGKAAADNADGPALLS